MRIVSIQSHKKINHTIESNNRLNSLFSPPVITRPSDVLDWLPLAPEPIAIDFAAQIKYENRRIRMVTSPKYI